LEEGAHVEFAALDDGDPLDPAVSWIVRVGEERVDMRLDAPFFRQGPTPAALTPLPPALRGCAARAACGTRAPRSARPPAGRQVQVGKLGGPPCRAGGATRARCEIV
jgi:hypothetical protein